MTEPSEAPVNATPAALRCFLVDDSGSDLAKLTTSLEELGHTVASTQDPQQVEERLAQQGDVDILFLDIVMPDRNGYAVLRSVKKIRPEQRTVMVSSKGEDSDLNWAFLQGADGYLTKPYSLDDVRDCLQKVAS